ncbi:MAG: hypothetical protein EB015_22880, partial [Methylocystaceae bacterium]|nr:hypothetical protein [Methylocystaceae bacterium]
LNAFVSNVKCFEASRSQHLAHHGDFQPPGVVVHSEASGGVQRQNFRLGPFPLSLTLVLHKQAQRFIEMATVIFSLATACGV